MSLTARDFEAIAHHMRWHYPDPAVDIDRTLRYEEFIVTMADALALTNPRFDRQRFIDACYPVLDTRVR